ncbi:MAG: class III signal peptide-containing protein [Candidatus Micrarchaeota archaeon]
MDEKGQTAIEYLLLISAVIMFVIIVFMMVRGVFSEAQDGIKGPTDDIWKILRGIIS